MNCLTQWVWLIPALPLAAALAIWLQQLLAVAPAAPGTAAADQAEQFPTRIALGAAGLSFLGVLGLDILAISQSFGVLAAADPLELSADGTLLVDASQVVLGQWLGLVGVDFSVSFLLDPLALSFATLFAFLGNVAMLFSTRYMHREPGFARYFAALSMYLGALLLIALSGSVWLSFVGWELAGVTSFLLIAYARERPRATGNALFVFLNNRIGDAGFFLAIGFATYWVGTLEWPQLLADLGRLDPLSSSAIVLGLVLAAIIKSAQIPFSSWIARSLDGPTPSSGIFYGCLTLHLGVFLLLRLEPALSHLPEVRWLIVGIGGITSFYGMLVGLTRADIKNSLVHSALVQVGLMFVACGLGFFEFAAWHLAAHAGFRLWQFLSSPSWLHATMAPQNPVRALQRAGFAHALTREGFGLESLTRKLLVWPTQRLARDVATIDRQLIEPALGMPSDEAIRKGGNNTEGTAAAHGLPGLLLDAAGQRLAAFEARLLVRDQGSALSRLLTHAGRLLMRVEELLRTPRYLFLFIMATLVIVL